MYFGNLIVYLLGDLRQLPPVMDPPLYEEHSKLKSLTAINGRNLLQTFQIVFHLTVCFRQEEEYFQKMLDNLSAGEMTENDYMFTTRFYANVRERNHFDPEVHLFAKTSQVDHHNVKS